MNPINILYVLAILSPFFLFPIFFIVRRHHPRVAQIIIFYAILFSLLDLFILTNGEPYKGSIEFLFRSSGTIPWLLSSAIAATINMKLSKHWMNEGLGWNLITTFICTVLILVCGLILQEVGQQLWAVIVTAANLVPLQ